MARAANHAILGTTGSIPTYIEDVFSTYLWEGNATARNIVNGIDLAGEGGMVWTKYRNTTNNHRLYDTARGATKEIYSSLTNAESTASQSLTAFNADGFSLGTGQPNENTATVVGWTFRKAEKFFDVVTYTGNGSNPRNISHNLGSTPGCMIVKGTDSTGSWFVYHRSSAASGFTAAQCILNLNNTNAVTDNSAYWSDTSPTSTQFTVGSGLNTNSATYVAYLFAHDAGGFGASGSDNVISCGSFTTTTTWPKEVELGYEPQWVLIKRTDSTSGWIMWDTMRGMSQTNAADLFANTSGTEGSGDYAYVYATGFGIKSGGVPANGTYIYIAIRRGPMKTPTSGTSVFAPVIWSGNGTTGRNIATGFPVDLTIEQLRTWTIVNANLWWDRLRGYSSTAAGTSYYLRSTNTDAEAGTANYNYVPTMDGFNFGSTASTSNAYNGTNVTAVAWNFKRAPGFFDVVCWTGDGVNGRAITHNLTVSPELIIMKPRDTNGGGTGYWNVWVSSESSKGNLLDNSSFSSGYNRVTATSSTTFTVTNSVISNYSGATYVAYLFASVTGVSKVGSYTGNGSSQTINCGFTGGARFVLIKRTDSTGDWVVFDSARGIVAGDDPYLELNTTDAEVTNKDAVDTDNSGFVVNETTGPNVNTNSATYIYLAIA